MLLLTIGTQTLMAFFPNSEILMIATNLKSWEVLFGWFELFAISMVGFQLRPNPLRKLKANFRDLEFRIYQHSHKSQVVFQAEKETGFLQNT